MIQEQSDTMLPDDKAQIVKKLSGYIPAFTDVFDEESFYIFAFLFVIGTVVGALVLSRYVILKDAGHTD